MWLVPNQPPASYFEAVKELQRANVPCPSSNWSRTLPSSKSSFGIGFMPEQGFVTSAHFHLNNLALWNKRWRGLPWPLSGSPAACSTSRIWVGCHKRLSQHSSVYSGRRQLEGWRVFLFYLGTLLGGTKGSGGCLGLCLVIQPCAAHPESECGRVPQAFVTAQQRLQQPAAIVDWRLVACIAQLEGLEMGQFSVVGVPR